MLIPYGLVEAEVHRTPWLSIGLGSTCIAVYLLTLFSGPVLDVEAASPLFAEIEGVADEGGFVPGPACRPLLGSERLFGERASPDDEAARIERAEQLCRQVWAKMDRHPQRRFAFVPARGFLQVGLLTSIFLHGGLLHLLGNLLFFFVCGPFLEDLWGRPFYLVFFLLGGAGACLAQGAADPHSYIHIVGASGAIAACMGALTVRYPLRHVKMLLFFMILLRPIVHRFTMKVWLWGGLWVGWEIVTQLLGGQQGVATMAHIGGFFFGVGVVFVLKTTGIEQRVLTPAVDKARLLIDNEHPEIAEADAALAEGRPRDAVRAFEAALKKQPDLEEALWGLARASGDLGHAAGEASAIGRLLRLFVSRQDVEGGREIIARYGTDLVARGVPANAVEGLARLLERRAPQEADALRRSLQTPGGGGAPSSWGPSSSVDAAPEMGAAGFGAPAPVSSSSLAVRPARFVGLGPQGAMVESSAGVHALTPAEVRQVAVGLVQSEGGLVVDLWVRPANAPQVVLRMLGGTMGLEHFTPAGAGPAQAFAHLVQSLLSASGARAVPSPVACTTGPFAPFVDVAEFERSAYGEVLSWGRGGGRGPARG